MRKMKIALITLIILTFSVASFYISFSIFSKRSFQENIIISKLGTEKSGKLILAETKTMFQERIQETSTFFFSDDSWISRYTVEYKTLWYIDLTKKESFTVIPDGVLELKVLVSGLTASEPIIIPETFMIYDEKRSWLLNEEKLKLDLVRNVSNEISKRDVLSGINLSEVQLKAEESIIEIVKRASEESGYNFDKITVYFKTSIERESEVKVD